MGAVTLGITKFFRAINVELRKAGMIQVASANS